MLGPVKPSGAPARLLDSIGPPGGKQTAPARAAQANETANPLRNIAFRMATVLIFIYFSCIHQLLTYVLHVNLYLLYLFGVPTLLGVVLVGGVQRTLRARPAICWTVFAAWMVVGVPFSTWPGGSLAGLFPYFRTVFPMLFVIAGLTFTWRECRSMMWAIAGGGVVIISAAKLFQDTGGHFGERLAIEFGTISNSNDYAVHLLYVLPFAIFVALTAKSKAFRIAFWAVAGFGILLVLKTASRGALVAMAAGSLYWLLHGTMRQRIGLLLVGPIAAVALVAFVPRSSLVRIVSFSADDANASGEALESSALRRYLLERSIVYTIQRPLFGLGFAQFRSYEGEHNQLIGDHGKWDDPHNSYTQVSSEGGIPALVFYLAAILSTFLLARRVYREACKRPGCEEIRSATFCIMLAMTMYCTGILFVNFSYFFYLPVMSSLVIAVSNAVETEFGRRSSGSEGTRPGLGVAQRWLPRRKPIAPAAI